MRRNWKRYRPSCLRSALEACVEFARFKHNRSVERVADLIGTSKWTVYKWIESGKLPANMIRPFEHACGATFVSQYLALSAGFLPIEIPTGRGVNEDDVMALQEACNEAVRRILQFAKEEIEPERVIAAIVPAMEQLAYHKTNAEKAAQPELEFLQ